MKLKITKEHVLRAGKALGVATLNILLDSVADALYYRKGQKRTIDIDAFNYDRLGSVDGNIFFNERMDILNEGLERLDVNGRIALKMKLRLDEYGDMIPSDDDPTKMVYKYQNNMKAIADVLEVPVPHASKIYKEALIKLSEYCQNQEK